MQSNLSTPSQAAFGREGQGRLQITHILPAWSTLVICSKDKQQPHSLEEECRCSQVISYNLYMKDGKSGHFILVVLYHMVVF